MIATVVETKELLQSVAASLIAGIGVTAVFSVVVFAVTRTGDMVRQERTLMAAAAGALAVLMGLVVAAVIAFGIVVMTQK
jgi:cytochrome c biogenesis protein CcdA